MKIAALISIIVLVFNSCKVQSDKVTITIDVSDDCSKDIKLISQVNTANISISPGGQHIFNYTTDSIQEINYFLNGYRLNLKIKGGDNVNISLEGKNGSNIVLKGGKFDAQNKYNIFKAQTFRNSWSKDESLMDSLTFKNQMDEVIKRTDFHLEDLLKNKVVDQEWIDEERMLSKYWVYNRLVSYPFMNAAYSYKDAPDEIPSFTNSIVNKEVLNKDEIATYGQSLLGVILYNYGKLHKANYSEIPNPSSIGNLEMVKKIIYNPKVKSIAAQYLLQMQLNEYSDANIQPILDYFNKNCLDNNVKTELLAKVEEISLLGPGKPAPEIELIDMDGRIHSLTDYKGKKIYIDVWATYCGKCIAEMPAVHELEKDYKNKNWIFLMVSLDTDNEKWQAKAKELGHLDRQFIVKDGHKSQFNKDYRIGYAPRYIIIDSKGKLVNFNAPFPSDKKTRRIMDKVM